MDTAQKLELLKDTYAGTPEFDQVLDKLLDAAMSHFRLRLERYERELSDFEQRHGMPSAAFYTQFAGGDLGDAMDFFEWAGLYELRQDLVARIQRLQAAA